MEHKESDLLATVQNSLVSQNCEKKRAPPLSRVRRVKMAERELKQCCNARHAYIEDACGRVACASRSRYAAAKGGYESSSAEATTIRNGIHEDNTATRTCTPESSCTFIGAASRRRCTSQLGALFRVTKRDNRRTSVSAHEGIKHSSTRRFVCRSDAAPHRFPALLQCCTPSECARLLLIMLNSQHAYVASS
ncbi:unnamed protein product [Toxocara canis]|uniref:Uncharacterized protein n=1 Tax=Toxocara canis TaxID=6265 RepID=A0A183TY34_TOXCA|nr:unnamed protein product [Toxocara canis]